MGRTHIEMDGKAQICAERAWKWTEKYRHGQSIHGDEQKNTDMSMTYIEMNT